MRLVALNLGTSPEMVHRHYGHDTKSQASEFADVWPTDLPWESSSSLK
jgi:hypothetical protein